MESINYFKDYIANTTKNYKIKKEVGGKHGTVLNVFRDRFKYQK